MYHKKSQTNNSINDSSYKTPDTVYQEKIVEKLRVDTFKVYVPVKPKVEKKDTTTPSLTISNQVQN